MSELSFSFDGVVEIMPSNVWGHIVIVPQEISDEFLAKKAKRLVITINEKLTFHGALMPSANGYHFIMLSADKRKKLGVVANQPVEVQIKEDNSKYGMEMPEEFQAVLDSDPEADEIFHALTPGKMRSLMYLATTVKNTDKRIRRSLIILEHIKVNKGTIDHKKLNQELKVNKD